MTAKMAFGEARVYELRCHLHEFIESSDSGVCVLRVAREVLVEIIEGYFGEIEPPEQGRFARYDLAVRAWAAQEQPLAARIARVDEEPLTYVRSLFSQLGFRGRELDMRARLFVVYHSMNQALLARPSEADEWKLIRRLHALFAER